MTQDQDTVTWAGARVTEVLYGAWTGQPEADVVSLPLVGRDQGWGDRESAA